MQARFFSTLLVDFFLVAAPFLFIFLQQKQLKKSFNLKEAGRELGFKAVSLKQMVKKTALLLVALVAVAYLLDFLLSALALNDSIRVVEAVARLRLMPWLLAWLLVVRAVAEEIFFRGFLVKRVGVFFSTVLFALVHLGYGSYAEVVGAFVLGLILAKAFQLNKNLYPNIAAHIAYNALAIGFAFGV